MPRSKYCIFFQVDFFFTISGILFFVFNLHVEIYGKEELVT